MTQIIYSYRSYKKEKKDGKDFSIQASNVFNYHFELKLRQINHDLMKILLKIVMQKLPKKLLRPKKQCLEIEALLADVN